MSDFDMAPNATDTCMCGTQRSYSSCCGPVHTNGAGFAAPAEALMRARYSAYVLRDRPFLLRSWHDDTRPATVEFAPEQQWHGLEILDRERGGALDTEGWVEFRARFRFGAEHFELHERSRFLRVDGQWHYVDGTIIE